MAAASVQAGGDRQAAASGVSAEDLVAAVRVHLDRVHDAVRRLGCEPDAALEVVEASAIDLVEVVAARPETVEDAVGWWFARASALGRRVATRADLPLGGGVLAVDEDQRVLSEGLDDLPERERIALLLRDSYDLPATSVGAALGTDADGAMELVGRARLAYLPLVDAEPPPPLPNHPGGLGALARLGEGGPLAARDATTRRHALSCAGCRAVTDAQQRAHLLLAGLTVAALPEADRAAVLALVEQAARLALPSEADLVLAVEGQEWDDEQEPRRLLSPLLALLAVVLAGLAGLGLGLVLADSGESERLPGADGRLPADLRLASPQVLPPSPDEPPPTVPEVTPQTRVFVVPPPEPEPPPPPPPTPSPDAVVATIGLSPGSGPNGTTLTVTGSGFAPGAAVQLDYLDAVGEPTGQQADAVADDAGQITATIVAQDPANVPGPHDVVATDGTSTARATFTAEP